MFFLLQDYRRKCGDRITRFETSLVLSRPQFCFPTSGHPALLHFTEEPEQARVPSVDLSAALIPRAASNASIFPWMKRWTAFTLALSMNRKVGRASRLSRPRSGRAESHLRRLGQARRSPYVPAAVQGFYARRIPSENSLPAGEGAWSRKCPAAFTNEGHMCGEGLQPLLRDTPSDH